MYTLHTMFCRWKLRKLPNLHPHYWTKQLKSPPRLLLMDASSRFQFSVSHRLLCCGKWIDANSFRCLSVFERSEIVAIHEVFDMSKMSTTYSTPTTINCRTVVDITRTQAHVKPHASCVICRWWFWYKNKWPPTKCQTSQCHTMSLSMMKPVRPRNTQIFVSDLCEQT